MKKIIYVLRFHSHDFENSYSENIVGCESEEKLTEIKEDMIKKSVELREVIGALNEEKKRLSKPFINRRNELQRWRLNYADWKTNARTKEREIYSEGLEEVREGLMNIHIKLIERENEVRERVSTLHGYWIEDEEDEAFEVEELEMVEV